MTYHVISTFGGHSPQSRRTFWLHKLRVLQCRVRKAHRTRRSLYTRCHQTRRSPGASSVRLPDICLEVNVRSGCTNLAYYNGMYEKHNVHAVCLILGVTKTVDPLALPGASSVRLPYLPRNRRTFWLYKLNIPHCNVRKAHRMRCVSTSTGNSPQSRRTFCLHKLSRPQYIVEPRIVRVYMLRAL